MVALAKKYRARQSAIRTPHSTIEVVDLFCGAGGTSTGILQACQSLGLRVNLTAVNHWTTAINTHSLNLVSDRRRGIHVRHLCEPVENLWPARVIPSRRLHLLCASCECTFHSLARGGGPCNEQSRSQPWQLIRWCSDIQVDNLLMENVREWVHWGPLYPCTCGLIERHGPATKKKHRKGHKCLKPIPERRGEYFRAFLQALRDLGYSVDFRLQNAADFGDPTSRKRLILLACRNRDIVWPKESHGPGRRRPWRTAREIIDWSLKGQSIFDRKKPLSENTLRRIAVGLQKFGGPAAHRGELGLVEPFILPHRRTKNGKDCRNAQSIRDPLHAVTATSSDIGLANPVVVQIDHGSGNGSYAQSVDAPVPTLVTKQNVGVVQPYIVKFYRTGTAVSIDQPLDTITTRDRFLLVEPRTGKAVAELDILFRMLQPHELAAAMSFPGKYQFTGSKEDAVKQIGNAVPVKLARAHALAQLGNLFAGNPQSAIRNPQSKIMKCPRPLATEYPNLHILHALMGDEQWSALFSNRLSKRSAAQMLFKEAQHKPNTGELNRRIDAITEEMRRFHPIPMRKPGAKLLI